MGYKFNLGNLEDDTLVERKEIRKFLSKKPIRCRMLLSLYQISPCGRTEISKHIHIDKRILYYWLQYLNDVGVVKIYNGKDIMLSDNHNPITNKIRGKYLKETEGYSFDKKRNILYYVITKKGESYIPFAGECIGIKIEEDE